MKKPLFYLGIIALLAFAGICILALTFHSNTGNDNPLTNETVNKTNTIVTASMAEESAPWIISGPGPVWKLYTAADGTIYSIQGEYGNTIKAIEPNGSVKWEYQVSDEWRVSNVMNRPANNMWLRFFSLGFIGPAFSVDNGTLYLYVRENTTTDYNHYPYEDHPGYNRYYDYLLKERLMAIKGGQLLWDIPISNEHHSFDDSNVYADNGRVYVFDDYSITVFSDNGSMLFQIGNASSPPAVDEDGNIYVVPAVPAEDQMLLYIFSINQNTVYKVPAGSVNAYSPDGTLMWQKDIGCPIIRPTLTTDLMYRYDMLPFYMNHTLYLPCENQIVALNTDGSMRWSKKYESKIDLMPTMPFDEDSNVYVIGGSSYRTDFPLHIISPDGNDHIIELSVNLLNGGVYGDTIDREIYSLQEGCQFPPVYLPETGSRPVILPGFYLTSYDMQNGSMRLQRQITQNETYALINSSNVNKLQSLDLDINAGTNGTMSQSVSIIRTTSDTIYLYSLNAFYEWPPVINKTHCNYSSDIYAFDKASGDLLWQKSLDTIVITMETHNDTLYYGTRDGRVFGGITRDRSEPPPPAAAVTEDIGKVMGTVAGGAALTGAAVLFIKFFVLGGLTRARGQLTNNDNRNKALKFVVDHPGSTLHEIAHGLDMNVGTVRYHLFILNLNHRIVIFKSDGKFVRYFTNSGSYSKDEKFVLSLVRRDPVRKILNLLLDNPEMSNLQISESLGIHESASSRYMKELADRGVVSRKNLSGGRTSYSICNEYREPVAIAIERIVND